MPFGVPSTTRLALLPRSIILATSPGIVETSRPQSGITTRACGLFASLGDVARQALVLLNRGKLERRRGQTEAAEAAFERSLLLYREVGDLQGIASALNRLGDLARERGDLALARTLHDEALAMFHQQRGDRWGQAIALNYLALAALADGDPAGTTALAQGALRALAGPAHCATMSR
ncbi:MAG: hypothetical protein KatS3mg060_2797 [Dehalococcoidia bacterium]|nr:MAG: hypothetical protein KatS3mg060_2797 [Dehalococcoidia bacterium]